VELSPLVKKGSTYSHPESFRVYPACQSQDGSELNVFFYFVEKPHFKCIPKLLEMKNIFRFFKFFLILPLLLPLMVKAQTVPVGMPVLAEAYRREQLLGKYDASYSFTSLPLFPIEAFKVQNSYDPDSSLAAAHKTSFNGITAFLPSGKTGENFNCFPSSGKISLTAGILPVTTMGLWFLPKAIRPISVPGFM